MQSQKGKLFHKKINKIKKDFYFPFQFTYKLNILYTFFMLSLPILESTINSTCLPIKSDFLIAHLKISIIWARISCYFINVDPLLKRASFLPLDPHSNYTFMLPFFYAYPSNQGQFISLLFPLRSLPQKPTQD